MIQRAGRKESLGDFLDLAVTDARGADLQSAPGSVNESTNGLQVHVPAAFRHVVRVTDPVAKLGAPAANFTSLRHKIQKSPYVRIFNYNNLDRAAATAEPFGPAVAS
jgi:hypothetical protein